MQATQSRLRSRRENTRAETWGWQPGALHCHVTPDTTTSLALQTWDWKAAPALRPRPQALSLHQPLPLDLELSLHWIVSGCGWQRYGSPINNTPRSQSLWLVVPQSWNLVRKQCHPAPCYSLWAAIKSTLTLLTLLPHFGQSSRIQSQHGTLQGQWETRDSDQMGRPALPLHTFPCGSSQIPSAAHSWAGQPVWGRSTRVLDTDRGEQGPRHTFAPGDFPWVTLLPKSVFSTTGQEEHSHWRDVGKLNEIMQIKAWIE